MSIIQYVLSSTACISIFYAFYLILFKKETNFRQLRYYLLVSIVLSLIFPFNNYTINLNVPVKGLRIENILTPNTSGIDDAGIGEIQNEIVGTGNPNTANYTSSFRTKVNWLKIFGWIYLGISVILVIKLIFHLLILVVQFFLSTKIISGGYVLLYNKRFKSTFSFFRWIFISEEVSKEIDLEQILLHEKIHASQFHSFDLLLIELLAAVMWFNPLVWMMKKEIQLVHEYLADEGVLSTGIDRLKYQALLINQVTEERLICLSSSFNHSLIKKRMIMMTKNKFNQGTKLKFLAIIPLAVFLFLGISCVKGQDEPKIITAVAPVKMNVLYAKIDNPIQIASSGYRPDELSVKVSNGEITGSNGAYNICPKRPGNCILTVSSEDKIVQVTEFRVKGIPDPTITIAGKTSGIIGLQKLIEQDELYSYVKNFEFDVSFTIVEFWVSITDKDGYTISARSNTNKITDQQKEVMKQVKSRGQVIFKDIKCKEPDGSVRVLDPIVFTLE